MTHPTDTPVSGEDRATPDEVLRKMKALYDMAGDALVSRDVWVERALRTLRIGFYATPSRTQQDKQRLEGAFIAGALWRARRGVPMSGDDATKAARAWFTGSADTVRATSPQQTQQEEA